VVERSITASPRPIPSRLTTGDGSGHPFSNTEEPFLERTCPAKCSTSRLRKAGGWGSKKQLIADQPSLLIDGPDDPEAVGRSRDTLFTEAIIWLCRRARPSPHEFGVGRSSRVEILTIKARSVESAGSCTARSPSSSPNSRRTSRAVLYASVDLGSDRRTVEVLDAI
jgi:hypothetical protein